MPTVDIPDWSDSERLFHQMFREPSDFAALIDDDVGQIDWQEIQALAKYHRVEALLAAHVGTQSPLNLPSELSADLRQKTKRQIHGSMGKVQATVQVAAAFRMAGVNCVLLKSDAVSQRYYDAPYSRFSKDIDFLISPTDYSVAAQILKELGYYQDGPGFDIPPKCHDMIEMLRADVSFKNKSNNQSVELHWRMFRNPNLFRISFSELLSSSKTIRLGQEEIAVLNPPNQLVYLMCHGAIHSWFRLKWLADIDRMAAQMTSEEFDEAREIAKNHGLDRIMHVGARVCRIVFGEHSTMSGLDQNMTRSDSRKVERILSIIHQRPEEGHGQKSRSLFELGSVIGDLITLLNLQSSIRYKLAELVPILVSESDVDQFRLSRNWLGFYVLVGPLRRIIRSLKTAFRQLPA